MERPNQAIADVVCECGHKGVLLFDCADRRGLSDQWFLVGFENKRVFKENWGRIHRPINLLERLEAECPECRRRGAVRYVDPAEIDRRFPVEDANA